ncbi:MAG: helix-turn-helix domain-containing protein, partial [Actinomycetota bacterium]
MPLQIESGSSGGIGRQLREAREAAALSIEEVSWRLRIRPDVLRALEDDDFSGLGHSGFVGTHLRSYSKLLGLDAGALVRAYRRTIGPKVQSSISALDEQEKEARRHLPRSRWLLAATMAAAGLLAASVFGVLRGPGAASIARRSAFPAAPRIQYEQASRGLAPAAAEQV